MESSSLVEQVYLSPQLWELFKWTVGILCGGYAALWYFIGRNLFKKLAKHDEKVISLCKRINTLELEVNKNYVTYTVFNTAIKEMKDEIHNSMRTVCDRLSDIDKFLRSK